MNNRYTLRHVPLDEYGFDDNGRYHGRPDADLLFFASNGVDEHYFRAESREEAKEMLRLQVPGIRFFS